MIKSNKSTPDIRGLINKSGLRFDFVAQEMGISEQNLNNKLSGRGRFLPHQYAALSEILATRGIVLPEAVSAKSEEVPA